MPSFPSLIELAVKKIANKDNFDISDLETLPLELKEKVLKKLPPEKLFNLWYNHYQQNEDIKIYGLSSLLMTDNPDILTNTLYQCFIDQKFWTTNSNLSDINIWLFSLNELLKRLATHSEVNMIGIKMLALAFKLALLKKHPEKKEVTLALQQLVLLGEFSQSLLQNLAQIFLIKLFNVDNTHRDHELKTSMRRLAEITDSGSLVRAAEEMTRTTTAFAQHNVKQRAEFVTQFITALQDKAYEKPREKAINDCTRLFTAFDDIQRTEVATQVLACLQDKEWSVRQAVIKGCVRIFTALNAKQRAEIATPLLACLQNKDQWVRADTITVCVRVFTILDTAQQAEILTQLLTYLQDGNAYIRASAINACATVFTHLDTLQCTEVKAQLVALLKDNNSDVCQAAFSGCATIFGDLNPETQQLILLGLAHDFNNTELKIITLLNSEQCQYLQSQFKTKQSAIAAQFEQLQAYALAAFSFNPKTSTLEKADKGYGTAFKTTSIFKTEPQPKEGTEPTLPPNSPKPRFNPS